MSGQEIISCRNGHKLRVPQVADRLHVTCPRCHDSFDWPPIKGSVRSTGQIDPAVITPKQYEELVATYYRVKGYAAATTPYSNDYGVDVFATKGSVKLAIQAKMYGPTGRPINREMVMQLHGAKDYFDCSKAVIVTDGKIKPDAVEVADKLRIDVHRITASELLAANGSMPIPQPSQFDDIWRKYVMPLAGKTITTPGGLTNTVLTADWAGLERRSSEGKVSRIGIEVFRKAVDHVLAHGSIARSLINEEYAKRGSSAVVLVLSQVPLFEYVREPQGIRLKS